MEKQINISWSEVLDNIENLREKFNFIEQSKANIALFGAGRVASYVLNYLQKNGYKIVCFIDNSKEKQGQTIDGIPIVSAEDSLVELVDAIIITVRQNINVIKKQFVNYKNISFDEWFMVKNIDKYQNIYENILTDSKSKKVLEVLLLSVLTGNDNYYAEIVDSNQYFALPHFIQTGTEYFVDAGAYVGDIVEKFIWHSGGMFKQIYAFEPGDKQYFALQKRVQRLIEEWALEPESISLIRAGIGEKNGQASFDISSNQALQSINLKISSEKEESSDVLIYSLDSVLENKPVTFIKADIEGMELDLLSGAKKIIEINKPKMALCTYHNVEDLFSIIEFIQTIVPEYKFALRHHTSSQSETVLYCWVEKDV